MKTWQRACVAIVAGLAAGAAFGQLPSPSPSAAPIGSPAASPAARRMPAPGMMPRSVRAGTISTAQRTELTIAGIKARQDPRVLAAAARYREAIDGVLAVVKTNDPADQAAVEKVLKSFGGQRSAGVGRLTAADIEAYRRAMTSIRGTLPEKVLVQTRHEYTLALFAAMRAADPALNKITDQMIRGPIPMRHVTAHTVLPRPAGSPLPSPGPTALPSPVASPGGTPAQR